MASKTVEARAVITGVDNTGGAFSSVEKRANELDRAMKRVSTSLQSVSRAHYAADRALGDASGIESRIKAIGSLTRQTEKLARVTQAAERATGGGRMARGMTASKDGGGFSIGGMSLGGLGTGAAVGLGAVKAAQLAYRAGKFAFSTQSANIHERIRMGTAGMSGAEIDDASGRAMDLSSSNRAFDQTQILHMLRNARSIVGSYSEASEIMEPMLKLRTVALGAHPEQAAALGEDFDKLIKGLEIKGVTQDLPKFTRYIDGMAKAINVFGDTLRSTDYYEMFKYGRQATQNLSEEYTTSVAPTLAQELGGSSAGQAQAAFFRAIVGGKMSNVAVQELNKLGLLDPTKVIKTSTGNVKGVGPGGIRGSDLAATNPYQWVQQYLLPALQHAGKTSAEDVQESISHVFSNQVAAQLVSLFSTQQSRIEKDAYLVRNAKGTAAAADYEKSPAIAYQELEAQTRNLVTSLRELRTVTESVAAAENWLAKKLADLANYYEKQNNKELGPSKGLDPDNLWKLNNAVGLPDPDVMDITRPDLKPETDRRRVAAKTAELDDKIAAAEAAAGSAEADYGHPGREKRAAFARQKVVELKAQRDDLTEALAKTEEARAKYRASLDDGLRFGKIRMRQDQQLPEFGIGFGGGDKNFGFGPHGTIGTAENAGEGGRTATGPLPPLRPPEFGGNTGRNSPSLQEILGGRIEATLAAGQEISANVRPDQITAKMTGEGIITVRAAPGSEVVSTASSGNIALRSAGTSMGEYKGGGRVSTTPGGIGGV